MTKFEVRAITVEVHANDVRGKEMIDILNEHGSEGWEPWHMFTSAAAGAWKYPGVAEGKIWISVWLKRALP